MPLLIDVTYEIITEESAENGEAEETGFVEENGEYTFLELVRKLRDYSELSCSGRTIDTSTWSTNYGDMDPSSGEYRTESIHYSHLNPPRNAKYWAKALRAAGLVK